MNFLANPILAKYQAHNKCLINISCFNVDIIIIIQKSYHLVGKSHKTAAKSLSTSLSSKLCGKGY